MKNWPLIIICLFSFQGSFGQDSCIHQQYGKIRKILMKSVPNTEESYSHKVAEFFILEINLTDRGDSILSIDYYKKDGAANSGQIQIAIEQIKRNWKPSACGIKRILVPVFIQFQSNENSLENYPFDLAVNKITPNDPGKFTYTGYMITIVVFGTLK